MIIILIACVRPLKTEVSVLAETLERLVVSAAKLHEVPRGQIQLGFKKEWVRDFQTFNPILKGGNFNWVRRVFNSPTPENPNVDCDLLITDCPKRAARYRKLGCPTHLLS